MDLVTGLPRHLLITPEVLRQIVRNRAVLDAAVTPIHDGGDAELFAQLARRVGAADASCIVAAKVPDADLAFDDPGSVTMDQAAGFAPSTSGRAHAGTLCAPARRPRAISAGGRCRAALRPAGRRGAGPLSRAHGRPDGDSDRRSWRHRPNDAPSSRRSASWSRRATSEAGSGYRHVPAAGPYRPTSEPRKAAYRRTRRCCLSASSGAPPCNNPQQGTSTNHAARSR